MINRFELNIFVSKTIFFCKSVTFKIIAIDNISCAIVLLRRIFLIISNCSNNSLFNIDKNIFNKKRIIDVLYQRLCLLNYNNYYTSYFFCYNTITKACNSNILKTIIILLD